jgi:hypothetical protein
MNFDLVGIQAEFLSSVPMNIFRASNKGSSSETMPFLPPSQIVEQIIYIIPNTYCIYFDYPIFKEYSTTTSDAVMDRIFFLIDQCISVYGKFELHINLRAFTITSVEQNIGLIQRFYERFLQPNKNYMIRLDMINVYHTPIMMKQIMKLLSKFNMDGLGGKSICHDKDKSPALLSSLLGGGKTT